MIHTPIVFLIFNRPEPTQRVFEQIAQAQPARLLVVADGPRNDLEAEKCHQACAVIEQVDWDCEVLTNFSETNLGCKRRISSGLDWAFGLCDEAIIIEDDCLPNPTFFRFCAELLARYRDDERIALVSGSNFQRGRKRGHGSYYFSHYMHIWGWASWRRVWKNYDVEMRRWAELRRKNWLEGILGNDAAAHWRISLDKVFDGSLDTWDLQLSFSNWAHGQLAILPNVNLVSNIGFNEYATHTHTDIYGVANMICNDMMFPLEHPSEVVCDEEADKFTHEVFFAKEFHPATLRHRIGRKLLATLPNPLRTRFQQRRIK